MKTNKLQPSCDQVQLEVLLFGEEDSAEFRGSAGHVEGCTRCQERLSHLAAEDSDWARVRTALRQDDQETGAGIAGHQQPRRMKLDFLEPPSHPELLGRLGRYDIEQVIGAGGMGIVLKGFDTELNRPVAIKVLAPHLAHSGPARQRFAREAKAAASIVHEHVVAIHDVQSDAESPYLVMRYVPGRSLQDRVEQEGSLLATEILRIGMQAAAGLAAAHAQGVIHRDVKPANILLENGMDRAMITDFGLARAADDATLTHSGIIAGTPHYMSPEQARGELADARSDLFSLGSVLYFMATGHPPFRAEQAMAILHRICHDQHRAVQEINPSLPDSLADTIDRLLEKKPGRRFPTAAEAQQGLARVLVELQQPPRWRMRRWLRRAARGRWRFAAAACLVLAVVAGGWVAGWFGRAGGARESVDGVRAANSASAFVASLSTDQGAFAQELGMIDQGLSQLEVSGHGQPIFTGSPNEPWFTELHNAQTAARSFEQAWLPQSDNGFGTNP